MNEKNDNIPDSRIFVPYFLAGLVINMFLRGRLDVDPLLILVLAFGLALGIWPLPKFFYPSEAISSRRNIQYALASILFGCTVASLAFPPSSLLAFVSTMIVCPLAFYAGWVSMQLRKRYY